MMRRSNERAAPLLIGLALLRIAPSPIVEPNISVGIVPLLPVRDNGVELSGVSAVALSFTSNSVIRAIGAGSRFDAQACCARISATKSSSGVRRGSRFTDTVD
jgi:hypothetical protein